MSRWPRPADFAAMTPTEFDDYTVRIGFDARIRTALAEPMRPADEQALGVLIQVRMRERLLRRLLRDLGALLERWAYRS